MPYAKYVIAGQYVEVYKYQTEKVIRRQTSNNLLGWNKDTVKDEVKEQQSYLNAKSHVRRLVNANFVKDRSSFLTLTYAENMQDLAKAKQDFLLFIKRLNWSFYKVRTNKLKYLAVYEFQKRGAIHFHIILFDVDKVLITKLRKLWKYGFVKINQLKNCDNVGAYISKYFTKDTNRQKNQKLFYRSFNLAVPSFFGGSHEAVDKKMDILGLNELRFAKDYKDYYGSLVQYRQWKFLNVDNAVGTDIIPL